MDHRSLYRTHRPQTFADVVGQRRITETLAHAVDNDRVHHAYLFTGPRGTGKTSTARILAKALNCVDGPTSQPCGQCPPCRDIADGNHVDVIEIDAASHGGVDDVRDLRDRVAFAPAQAAVKVYIVDECHMLSTAGWNAFLKTVEEPPGHVVFVFATTEPHKVLDTILSRTQRFDFHRVGQASLAAHVDDIAAREGMTVDPVARDLVVRAGDGSVRDTLSVLDQVRAFVGDDITADAVADVLGTVGTDALDELVGGIAAGDIARLCALVGRLADSGVDLRQLARDAVEHLRRLLLLRAAPDTDLLHLGSETAAALRATAEFLGTAELLRSVELLAEAQAQMRRGNVRLPLELALIKAARPEATGDPAAIAARLDRLERDAAAGSPTPPGDARPPAATDPAPAPPTPAPEASGPEPEAPAPEAPAPEAPGPEAPAPETPAPEAPAPEHTAPSPAHAPTRTEPSPAAGPAPTAAASGDGTAVTVERVAAEWPTVLERIKARKRTVHACLAEGRPTGLDAGVVTLSYAERHKWHAEQVATDRAQELFADACESVVGVRLQARSRVVVDDAAHGERAAPDEPHDPADDATQAAAVAEVEAGHRDGERTDAGPTRQAAVEALQQELGAHPLGDTDAGAT